MTRILSSLLLLLVPSLTTAADLQITDSKGAMVIVKDAAIDYGGILGSELDKEGMRLQQGDATVRLKWSEVQSVSVMKVDTSEKPERLDLEVVLVSGTRVAATLLRKGAMTLTGKAPLGDYTIPLDKVRKLVPVR